MTEERINKAIEIINFAIEKGISVKKASVKNGFADTYVKNVKRNVQDKYDADILEDELYSKFMDVYEKYDGQANTPKIEGEKLSRSAVGDTMEIEWNGSNSNFDHENEITHQGYPVGHIKTLDQLLEKSEVDLNFWNVDRYVVNKWDVTGFKQGYPQTWENFQVKASLSKIKEKFEAQKISDIFIELVKDYKPPIVTAPIKSYNPSSSKTKSDRNLLEISLFDLHIGKLGWAGEVGENYDTKIACARFHDAINDLLRKADGFDYDRILFPIGNDFFNSDNLHNTTTNGTPQDEDLRWQKTYKMGCKLIVDGINMLKSKGVPIDVVVIPGNHDFERSFYLGEHVAAWFRNDEQVNIDNGANPRKYYKYGEVLLGLTHGNNEKENSLPLLMATEQKELWGNTTYHEWHLGHFHKKRNVKFTVFDKAQVLNEDLGVTVRYLSSLTGTEEWHFKKGYVGTHKAGEAFIWNSKTGFTAHLNFNFTNFDREH